MIRSIIVVWIAALVLLTGVATANAQSVPQGISGADTVKTLPKLLEWVNDYEGDLNQAEQAEFTKLMMAHEKKTSNQIVLVTVDSISPYTDIAEYTTDLANHAGIGQKGKDNGVLIVFSQKLRLVRIGVGLGLENRLTDSVCSRIIQESMTPRFRDGAYATGLSEGLQYIILLLESRIESTGGD